MRIGQLALLAALLPTGPALALDASALPNPQGKAGPAIEALHSCTTQSESGNLAESSKRAFVIECIQGNLAAGPSGTAPAPTQAADCQSVASYLELVGSARTDFVDGCMRPGR